MPPVPSLRSALLTLLLVGAVASSTGCSAIRMGMFLSGVTGGEHYTSAIIPDGPIEERVVVETPPLAGDAPPPMEPPPPPPPEPPVVVVPEPWPPPPPGTFVPEPPPPPVVGVPEPPPPPVVVVPEPPPPPPPCVCERQQRHEHVIVVGGYRQFGVIEKILLGMVGLFEGVVAVAAFKDVVEHAGAPTEHTYVAAAIGTVAAADALGLLAIILFMPTVDTEYERREAGTFRAVETFPCSCGPTDTWGACPSGHTGAPPA